MMGANPIKTSPPPFLVKTYAVVEDPATDDIVSWNDDGTAFIVWRPAEFARDLLPKLFKHSNFSSFVRQLNTYGFHKITTTRWEFSNDMFRKGELDQLRHIHRRQASLQKPQQAPPPSEAEDNDDQRSSSTSSSSEFTTVADENKRLKQENQALSSELAAMQSRCKELLELTTIYRSPPPEKEESNGGPKLFGVRLEVKKNL